jgi:hypothetical protein
LRLIDEETEEGFPARGGSPIRATVISALGYIIQIILDFVPSSGAFGAIVYTASLPAGRFLPF